LLENNNGEKQQKLEKNIEILSSLSSILKKCHSIESEQLSEKIG